MGGRWTHGLWVGTLAALMMVGCSDEPDPIVTSTPGLSTPTETQGNIDLTPTPTAVTTDTPDGPTATPTPRLTPTPTPTQTPTPTATSTGTPGETATPTGIIPPTNAPTPTPGDPTVVETPIPTPDPTPTPGDTPTQGDTGTPGGSTPSPTATLDPTPTATVAPTPTARDCGNGFIDDGEECDDGDLDSGDGCSESCELEDGFYCQGEETSTCIQTICGDGIKTPDEACDDGDGNSDIIADACRTDCELASCGDGIKDEGELCDDGLGNDDDLPNSCRTNCTLPSCGDGIMDLGEQCDDGLDNSDLEGDACRTNCTLPRCGDGVKDSEESCDEGTGNSDFEADSCRADCELPTCGDGTVDSDEACDNGDENSDTEPNACRSTCQPAGCGDGILDTGEQCDDGAGNSDEIPGACRTTCRDAGCGDGILDEGEACDDGDLNSDDTPDACREDCELAFCGDGIIDEGEACDDGDLNSDEESGACRTTCELPVCGDGITDPGEGCDDGNDDNTDECSTECAPTGCGDGFLNEGEECDEGELNSDEDPDACRTTCALPSCGDDILDSGEACDDGAENSDVAADACREDCELASCGDGTVDTGEECDEGDLNSEEGICSTSCTVNIDYEEVLVMGSNGSVLEGSWEDFYDRITEDVSDCKVRFDGRVAKVEHVEYATNSIYLDFQPLNAYYNSWDAYGYIHLNKGIRAGLGATYRRGLEGTVALKDRTQHAESAWNPMNVTVMCPRVSGYEKIASFNTRGEVTSGSFEAMRERIVQEGATCKIRADRRVMHIPHIEYDANTFYFDTLGLQASHNTWDAYAYATVDLNNRAGIGASLRRGHDDNVYQRDRDQYQESYFLSTNVDVYCADDYESVAKILYNGRLVEGDWDDLWQKAVEEGRSCKFRFDERIASPEYMEYAGGNLRFDFANLNAFHDSWDAYAYLRLIEGGQAGLGTNYRRGRYQNVWQRSQTQHSDEEFIPLLTEVFCESSARWEHVYTHTSEGDAALGDWDEFYDLVVEQGADCKARFDGRIGLPPLVEFTDGYLLFDYQNLAGMHNSWDAYATHVVAREASSGLSGSYRRGHADTVWKKDRDQNSLYTLQAYDTEFLCRRPGGIDPSDLLCGNGRLNPGEECDDGAGNSDTDPDACRSDCALPVCGDGVVDEGEECDEGGDNSNGVGSTCSTTCQEDLDYELVLSMTGDGTVIEGDFSDLYDRITEEAATCRVRFDDRIAEIEHIEYSSNNLYLDFQGLAAYYNSWDAYAYIHLYRGNRAGLGAAYRRGLGESVSLKDRVQHGEAYFQAMPVDVFCERSNPYVKVASFNTSGQDTVGSFEDLYARVVDEGAECKVRVDRRIFKPEHVEYGDSSLKFDAQNLSASHDTWDAYAYVEIDQSIQAGLGTSLRRGHDDNVHLRDRAQYQTLRFDRYPVDVFCADTYEEVLTITRSGEIASGDWDHLFELVSEEGRSCKVAFDRRIAPVEYAEYFTGDLRFDFQRLHAVHDSWDAYAYAFLSESGTSGVGSSYRRGRYQNVWQRSQEQHSGGEFVPRQMSVFCEAESRWESIYSTSYDGFANDGDWEDMHHRLTEQASDCKIRVDGRILDPTLLEFTEDQLNFDQSNLAGMHNSWDAYATNIFRWENDSGLSGSYRRGHADTVWAKDRQQNSLYTLQLLDMDLLCRVAPEDALPEPICGDGEIDLGEECDDGEGNADDASDACRTDCRLPICGDGVIDAGEDCDDGDANSDDVGATCSRLCTEDPYYERVLRMSANGTVLQGDWDDAFNRITEEAQACKVRFDERVARVEHVEYSSNNLYLDFQGLSAYYNSWDAYAYVHLSRGSRAGLGAAYRRGLGEYVHLKDRVQHGEAKWTAMTVDLYCPRENPYEKVASLSSSGQMTLGDWDDLYTMVANNGADCRVRADKRVMDPQHLEVADGRLTFDMLGLTASHDTWDAYAYVDLELGVRAGIGTSLRRGHDDHVYKKDRDQYQELAFIGAPVDVFCADVYDPMLVMESSGSISEGAWDDAYVMASEEMRTCKVGFDDRIAEVPYTEFFTGDLRMEFTPLHAYHDNWDSFAYASMSPGDVSAIGSTYRRGRYSDVWKRSLDQHSGGEFLAQNTTLFCEMDSEWEHVMALSYDGSLISGRWDDLYRRLVGQAADCKVVFDGRVSEPVLVEYREGDLLLDYANLAAMHNSWDAYASHPVRRGALSGISASYRRGHADTVSAQDRDQNSLYSIQAYDLDFYCR